MCGICGFFTIKLKQVLKILLLLMSPKYVVGLVDVLSGSPSNQAIQS